MKNFWVYDDKIMSKKLFYTDPYYSSKIKNIFGYGKSCHYHTLFYDIENKDKMIKSILCRLEEKETETCNHLLLTGFLYKEWLKHHCGKK